MSINVCNDRSMASITSLPSGVSGGSLVLLSEQTASSSSTISFTSGIDSTYKEYILKFINVHPSTNEELLVNFRDGGSNFDATKTTTFFVAYHSEAGNEASLTYVTSQDLAQSTNGQVLSFQINNDNDECCSGTLHLFDPSNTTFVKHFIATTSGVQTTPMNRVDYVAGYCNTTAAIDGVQFSMSSGNIDSGTFKLYGVV